MFRAARQDRIIAAAWFDALRSVGINKDGLREKLSEKSSVAVRAHISVVSGKFHLCETVA
jgi:hypothetical protein